MVSIGFQDSSTRALQLSNGRIDIALDFLNKQAMDIGGAGKTSASGYTKLIRKPSIERELVLARGSPALDSGTGSSRSDSPRLVDIHSRYSPSFNEPPPPPPPRHVITIFFFICFNIGRFKYYFCAYLTSHQRFATIFLKIGERKRVFSNFFLFISQPSFSFRHSIYSQNFFKIRFKKSPLKVT